MTLREGGGSPAAARDPVAPRWMRPVATALFAVAGLALAAVAAVLLVAPPGWSLGILVGDDAGYYFAIARNVSLGHGFSFDRLHLTNGFNPLFPAILIVLYALVPGAPSLLAGYRIGAGVSLVAVALAGWLFLRVLARILDRRGLRGDARRLWLAAGATYFALFIGTKGYYGMDASLVLLFGLVYLERVLRSGPLAPGTRAAVIDGMLLALLFLARVDSLPILVAAAGVMTVEALTRRAGLGALALRLGVAATACAPYLAWSTARFGTWLPVSARIKSAFPELDLARSLDAIRHTSLNLPDQVAFAVAGSLAAGTLAILAPRVHRAVRVREPLEPVQSAFLLFSLYLLGRLGYMLLFSRMDVQGSYAILAHVFNPLAGVVVVTVGSAPRRIALAGIALAAVSLALGAGKLRTSVGRFQAATVRGTSNEVALGREIHARTRAGDVLYGGAFGLLGFFTDRPWINGDGVANTYAYQHAFLLPGTGGRGGLEGYLRENRVTHIVFTLAPGTSLGTRPIPLTVQGFLHGRANVVEVRPEDVVLQRRVTRGGPGGSDLYVARWRP